MKNVVSLSLLGVLIAALVCQCKEELWNTNRGEKFTVIYSEKNQILQRKSSNFFEAEEIATFASHVSNLAVGDSIFVSLISGYLRESSTIWFARRSELYSKTSNSIVGVENNDIWREFDVAQKSYGNVTSMLLVNGYLFVGFSNKILWRCKSYILKSCLIYDTFDNEITGIDYNPETDKLYVSLSSGLLMRCPLMKEFSCEEFSRYFHGNRINTIKISFGAIWIAIGSQLWRCPFIDEEVIYHELPFAEFPRPENEIKSISATRKHLYVSAYSINRIAFYDPQVEGSWNYVIPKTIDMGPFIIVMK